MSPFKRPLFQRPFLAATLILLAAACEDRKPQDSLSPEGPEARMLDDLIGPVFLVAGVVFVLVQGLILYAVIRFRRRSEEEAPKQTHGNWKFELSWTILPFLVLVVVGFFTVSTLFDLNERPTGPDVVQVKVTGHQWWWEYHYPDLGITTANVLVIPKGRPVDIALTSEDVIHNFWPPKLAGKVYAIPTRTNHMTLEADKAGTYYGQCAEFCGISHANMRLRVESKTADGFERWVKDQQARPTPPLAGTPASQGKEVFLARGCASCHTVSGVSKGELGPDLTHLKSRNVFAGAIFEMNHQNLRKWLRDPPGQKAGSTMPNLQLTEDEITKLIAYLDTLQ